MQLLSQFTPVQFFGRHVFLAEVFEQLRPAGVNRYPQLVQALDNVIMLAAFRLGNLHSNRIAQDELGAVA